MPRLLIVLPTGSYRTPDFVKAAERLSVDLVIGAEETSTFESREPAGHLTLNLSNPDEAAQQALRFSKKYPLDAVLGVDDATGLVAATISEKLNRPHIPVEAASDTLDKFRMHKKLAKHGIPVPNFRLLPFDHNLEHIGSQIPFPCVLKPLNLAAGRGVIRADSAPQFTEAFGRIRAIVSEEDRIIPQEDGILVEEFIPGDEVAVEGIVIGERVFILGLFDKPDPLNGPYFPETIYLTPSRLPRAVQKSVHELVLEALPALGIRKGPFHAELRIHGTNPRILEIASRTIGGHCSRMLQFGTGSTLEELVIREALGMAITAPKPLELASGVLMLAVPRKGTIRQISGLSAARRLTGIRAVDMTAHVGQLVSPLPEGRPAYLGFVFSDGPDPGMVEEALRRAGKKIRFRITDTKRQSRPNQPR